MRIDWDKDWHVNRLIKEAVEREITRRYGDNDPIRVAVVSFNGRNLVADIYVKKGLEASIIVQGEQIRWVCTFCREREPVDEWCNECNQYHDDYVLGMIR